MSAVSSQLVTRIAMWSGPRNISTAMMRSWENRPDTNVVDEPFYACYLAATGIQHPMQDEVLASQSTDWQQVTQNPLTDNLSEPVTIQYQKHMTQHMVEEIDRDWFASLKHAFLIRHPAQVVASYGQKRGSVTAADVGFEQQFKLFEMASTLSDQDLPVIDSNDVLRDPKRCLTELCSRLGVAFDPAMLSWPAGKRDSDGVWASHWYHNVEKSTGFAPYVEREPQLTAEQHEVVEQCLPFYQRMQQYKI